MGIFNRLFGKSRKLVAKAIDDAIWSDISDVSQIGQVSMKAVESNEKTLTPKQCYELSTAVNACVNAICRNLAKAKVRLFRPDGKEIVGGRLYSLLQRPAPGLTLRRFIWDVASWWNIAGEFAILKDVTDGEVTGLIPLDPTRLSISKPITTPRDRRSVVEWAYEWHDGATSKFSDNALLFEAMFNPNHPVRGLSPLVTGGVEAGTGYSLARYNKSFFDNGAVPSHTLILPDGTSNAQRKDIERRYKEEFGNNRANAHKVMVIAGKDAKIETLEQPFQDGAFMELRKSVIQQIAMLYRVPAIEAGIYDKTRFDTAAEERKLFVESTLMPQMDVISEVLQSQLVDMHFSFDSDMAVADTGRMTKAMDESFEQARTMRQNSRVIVLMDPDTLPIMGAVKAAQIAVAKEFRDTLMLSAKETGAYFGLEIEDRKEREDVWIDRKYVNVTNPEINQKFMPQPRDAKPAGGKSDEQKKPAKKPSGKKKAVLTQEQKATGKAIERAMRRIKKLTLDAIDDGRVWTLSEADAYTDGSDLSKRAVRLVRHHVRPMLSGGDKDAAKQYFNNLDVTELVAA